MRADGVSEQIPATLAGARHLLVCVAVALLLGCQQSAPVGPTDAPPASPAAQLKDQGEALAARGDYAGAAAKYQAAVDREPTDVSLRFALGTVLSHLNRPKDTAEQFRFVVDHGQPDSREVQTARHWLVRAGELADTVSFSSSSADDEEPAPASSVPASNTSSGTSRPARTD